MADYLLLESGDNLLLESGDLFLLESSGATPTPSTGRALWDTGYTLFIEAAFSAATGTSGVWDSGLWDTATWGPDIVWSDITPTVFGWDSKLGRANEAQHASAGAGNVVCDNSSGDFTPENLSGPYVSGGVTGVRPGRPIRGYVVRNSDSATFPVFYGHVEDFPEDVNRIDDPVITFTWVDDLAALAAVDGYEQTPAGSGELVGRRMHRLLDDAEWDGDRVIDLGDTTMQPTTLAQNRLTEVYLTADSDGGDVWVEPSATGRQFVFQDREAPLRNTRSNTVQWTFTDTGAVGTLPYETVDFRSAMDLLINRYALARAGGSVQTDTDLTSRSLYGLSQWGRSDLICETDTQVVTLGELLLQRRADPSRRPRSVVLRPRIYADLWPVVLGARRWDRVSVTVTTSAGTTITHACFVDGIEHQVGAEDWVTTIRLASAAGWASASEFGVWDTSEWDGAYWAPDAA